ncbi:MAG: pyridoxal phosphate-dependent aminotransferase [Deltaproteobacteria bacterium]|nr:pyridoxal phosphate-dependent aminotransferase [Deltaproteobacteria bacterium]
MPGFLSTVSLEPNALESARLRMLSKGKSYIDLTEANPTKCGYLFPQEILSAAATHYLSQRSYKPDPRGLIEARRTIKTYYSKRTPSLEINEEQIFITASTSEAYHLIFSLLCDSGDNLLAPDPCYPLFDTFALESEIELKSYRLIEEKNWQIEYDTLCTKKDARTRGMLLISPHNPTGAVITERSETLAQLTLPLISDEVFAEFTHHTPSAPPLGALYPDTPVFHLNGISKMFALPDLKLGWIALNDPAYKIFGKRLEILNDAYLSASSLTQSMLPVIFEKGLSFTQTMISRVTANVRQAQALLDKSGLFDIKPPAAGTFIYPRLKIELDDELLALNLLEAGVLIHPGYFYGTSDGTHIMISCLPPNEILTDGIKVILHYLKQV